MNAPSKPLTPPFNPILFLPFLMHFQRQVDLPVFLVQLLFRNVRIVRLELVEIRELIQAQQAEFPQSRIVDAAFFQRQFAANHFVARRRVSYELDSPHIKLLSFVDIDFEKSPASSRRQTSWKEPRCS